MYESANRAAPLAQSRQLCAYRSVMLLLAIVGTVSVGRGSWIQLKASLAQRLISSAWAREQAGEHAAKPWAWADTHPVAKLTLGSRGYQIVALEGSSGRNLAFGPVHDPSSVLPGAVGNSVIEGHRDTHFSALRHLQVGDPIQIELPSGGQLAFAVTNLQIVDSRRWRIALDGDSPGLTLVTCYPFDAIRAGGPLRYVVSAGLNDHPRQIHAPVTVEVSRNVRRAHAASL
ncbi:MAG: class GN sortase [Sinobacteraceae bacterium]|nr:class GN sortase [Nevskiaceae bacterium]